MKFVFKTTIQGNWYFRLVIDQISYTEFYDTTAGILDIKENEFIDIITKCGGVRGYEINPHLTNDDHFYFKTYEQCLIFEKVMEPYLIMAELMA